MSPSERTILEVSMNCGHTEQYRCSGCGECYPCKHKQIDDGQFVDKSMVGLLETSLGWQCPNGKLRPIYAELYGL